MAGADVRDREHRRRRCDAVRRRPRARSLIAVTAAGSARVPRVRSRAPSPEVCSMRSASWTRGAACALAISVSIPVALPVALADRGAKSIASCTSFDQQDKGDDRIEFTIRNSCTMPVDCSISWRVLCAPESRKRRASHPGATRLSVSNGGALTAEASAAICGDDGWSIDSISWSCQPNRE
jgi:hypothetical protein